jgi:3-hydroxybutyryl-CoA dehydratase
MQNISELGIQDVQEGHSFSFDTTVSEQMIDDFAELTGDISPLHMDREFARLRGFKDRVVHGALLGGLISKLIGVHLPGRNCLLHSMNIKYPLPTYPNEPIRLTGTVEQVSVSANAMTMEMVILAINSASMVAKGKVTVGFTTQR